VNRDELNANHDGELEPKKESAALCVAMGGRLAEAAATAGVAHQTVKIWSMSAEFKRRVSQLRSEMTDRALGVLADNAANAALKIASIALNSTSERTQLRAACKVIELLIRVRELTELEERVALLEQQAQSRKPNRMRIA
jgi:hypothetical protein